MMAETIRCYIPPPLEIVAARRGGGSRETGEAHPRGIVRADAASAAVEAEDMVPMGSASGVVTGRCALVDARSPIAVDPTVAFFPRGAVRRTARGRERKSAREKIQKPIRSGIAPGHFQRHLSNVLFPPVTDRRLGRCVRCRRNRPLPTTKTGAHEARGKKERHRDRGAVERRARTPLRARHGRRSPRVRHSRSPHVSPLRDPARARHRRRVRPPNRARRRLSNAVVIGGCVGCTVFSNRAAGRRARAAETGGRWDRDDRTRLGLLIQASAKNVERRRGIHRAVAPRATPRPNQPSRGPPKRRGSRGTETADPETDTGTQVPTVGPPVERTGHDREADRPGPDRRKLPTHNRFPSRVPTRLIAARFSDD